MTVNKPNLFAGKIFRVLEARPKIALNLLFRFLSGHVSDSRKGIVAQKVKIIVVRKENRISCHVNSQKKMTLPTNQTVETKRTDKLQKEKQQDRQVACPPLDLTFCSIFCMYTLIYTQDATKSVSKPPSQIRETQP